MINQDIRFGVIGCGLMGREFASAAARWNHLRGFQARPRIVAVCDTSEEATNWFVDKVPDVKLVTRDYQELLARPDIDAVYCALPHNMHAQVYVDIIKAGKHLLGEKPFGMNLEANQAIRSAVNSHPNVLIRCSSEFPFYPGAFRIAQWIREQRFGRIIDVDAGFWHCSDLDPRKPINWKRQVSTNGEYGCMGDLGMHVVHIPLRFGWLPHNVRAHLSKVVSERPDINGTMVPCDTWDNAILSCEVKTDTQHFPMTLSMKRVAPGHANTWFIRINGTECSAEFSTKNPKQISYLPYDPGEEQAWRVLDIPHCSAYPTITGDIFEFGFSDSILQMWAAFCDEIWNGLNMKQPFTCVTPTEASWSHILFTAALESNRSGATVTLDYGESLCRVIGG